MRRNILNIYTGIGLLLFLAIQLCKHAFKVELNENLLLIIYIITIIFLITGFIKGKNK